MSVRKRPPASPGKRVKNSIAPGLPAQPRIKQIQDFHVSQLRTNDECVAMIFVGITESGMVNKVGLGIETTQARVMLDALAQISTKLNELIISGSHSVQNPHHQATSHCPNVIPIDAKKTAQS